MRRIWLYLAIVGSGLANAGPLRAGVYNLDPPPSRYRSAFQEVMQPNPTSFFQRVADLRAIKDGAPKPGSLRAGYENQLAQLQARQEAGVLRLEDRVNLGACLIRMGRFAQAQKVLEEAERMATADAPCRFLILLNLASVYLENPDLLPRALDAQTRALKAWPRLWAGWSSTESNWYHRVETVVLRLLHLRNAEARLGGRVAGNYRTVDALFPGVRFVGTSGRYEPGTIAFESGNQLPRDAESIAMQLVLWVPADDRLYWLYGELLNARGQVDSAYHVLNELVAGRNEAQAELRTHRSILWDVQEEFKKIQEFGQQQANWEKLIWALAPRGALTTPGLGSAASETAWLAALQLASPSLPPPPPSPAAPPLPSRIALPDWRHITVSFLTGMVVAVLGALQWRQWRPQGANSRRKPAGAKPNQQTIRP